MNSKNTSTTKTISPVLGYDPGFGNTKVCLNGQTSLLQSAVSIPHEVGLAAIGLRSAGRSATLVEIQNRTYAVGVGASAKGTLKTSMDYSSLTSPERRALLYGAAAQAMQAAGVTTLDEVLLVVGLPVPLLEDQEQARAVMDSLKQLKGSHAFSINLATNGGKKNKAERQAYTLGIDKIKVLAQPAGAYIDYAYNADLQLRKGVGKVETLCLDVGMNTLDVYVLKNGQVLESFIGGAEVGVRRLLELMATNGHDLMELDAELRTGNLKLEAGQLESYLGEVLAALKRIASNLRRFDVVIPCGGGALVLGDRLKYALAAKGALVQLPEDPIAANVRGFWKYGVKSLKA